VAWRDDAAISSTSAGDDGIPRNGPDESRALHRLRDLQISLYNTRHHFLGREK
jgi:hypothetical protein